MTAYQDLPAELITERLRLRRWRPADASEYRGLWLERDPRGVRRIDEDLARGNSIWLTRLLPQP